MTKRNLVAYPFAFCLTCQEFTFLKIFALKYFSQFCSGFLDLGPHITVYVSLELPDGYRYLFGSSCIS